MGYTVRQRKMGRLVQRELGQLLQSNKAWVVGKEWVTVMEVRMSPDLSLARVYISIMLTQDKQKTLDRINLNKGVIRKALGAKIGKQARLVPELAFFIDEVEEQAAHIESLIATLTIAPPDDEKVDPA